MKSDRRGCSTCLPGQENWEGFISAINKKRYIQYDYRTPGGKLFSCVAPTLEEARQRRDHWLQKMSLCGK